MKKIIIAMLLSACSFLPKQSAAQAHEIAQLVLNIEKLAQFKQILSDMKAGYQILQGGYGTVKNIAQGNFTLHQDFLNGLWEVSPVVRDYRRVGQIITYQLQLVQEYQRAYQRFSANDFFNPGELQYIVQVYQRLLRQSLRSLDELLAVITSGAIRMSDDERLKAIDRIFFDMQEKLTFLRDFNGNTAILGIQRAKAQNDIEAVRRFHQISE